MIAANICIMQDENSAHVKTNPQLEACSFLSRLLFISTDLTLLKTLTLHVQNTNIAMLSNAL